MIAIIDYNAGNTGSVYNALQRLGAECIITSDHALLKEADKVILPGVGEASSAMRFLKTRGLDILVPTLTQPFLGVCLGLQLMCGHSAENNTVCLGIFDVEVKKFPSTDIVPHMGWSDLYDMSGCLFRDIKPGDNVYFVHSYYAELSKYTSACCNYILPFSAALQKNNFYATQFHPEKSAAAGETILKNFISL